MKTKLTGSKMYEVYSSDTLLCCISVIN